MDRAFDSDLPPAICYEDEHLLAINKPPGLNTHAPSPFANEGLYDWLRHRDPRWASLAIIHRLDKETSGLIVFSKTTPANQSLTRQFTSRAVTKQYLLLTDRPVRTESLAVESNLVRAGEKYASRPLRAAGQHALTRFHVLQRRPEGTLLEARPVTGRTHQIRVHAAAAGFPILGDTLYGGTWAERLCLHAQRLHLRHPTTNAPLELTAPIDFTATPCLALRQNLFLASATNAWRVIHGASDGWPGWYVDRLGDYLLSQAQEPLSDRQLHFLRTRLGSIPVRGVYHKPILATLADRSELKTSPQPILGDPAPDRFLIRENNLQFELSFLEGYSVGLFLDQRDNRRRFLLNWVAADFPALAPDRAAPEILNTFAYTCGFSVCAAKAGARVTSLDLSRKYLEWGQHHFRLNDLDPGRHEFIRGDAFDWLRRLAKKGRLFDAIILDPPTFSRSRASGLFRAEKSYGQLVSAALRLLKPKGVLFCSSNTARLSPERFLAMIEAAIAQAKRRVLHQHYAPQPPDFPITRNELGYLKTVWLRIS